jgi:phenylacetaldehyde dehydrogenase
MSTSTDQVTSSGLPPEIAATPRRMLVGGRWTAARSGETIPVYDPATGGQITAIPRADAQDVDDAVAAARRAFDDGPWPRLPAGERGRLLNVLADLIERHAGELALIETLDNGKPIVAARAADIGGSIAKLRYVAGWTDKLHGTTVRSDGELHAFTVREPIGVAALIVPWNFPLMMAVSKLSEALAAGCCAILKPAEQTSLSALRLGELICEAGFPEGVVNVVTGLGPEAGAALVEHPGVDKVSFTGSTAVGKSVLTAAAVNMKRLTLELGGKSPSFVFGDADIDRATESVARNIFYNAGQVCAAGSRVYAHASVYDELVEQLVAKARALKIGPGIDETTELGPLVSDRQRDRVLGYIASGVEEGAVVACGGAAYGDAGYFVQPTILAETTAAMRVRREEIFGPVLCVSRFEDTTLEALAIEANDTDYGLSAFVYTRDLATAHRMGRLIKAGFVRVNGAGLDWSIPFGGYKQSGWGRENGPEGVMAFTELKAISMAL